MDDEEDSGHMYAEQRMKSRTPTPLRDALEDVMATLQNMEVEDRRPLRKQSMVRPATQMEFRQPSPEPMYYQSTDHVQQTSSIHRGGFRNSLSRKLTINRPKSSLGLGRHEMDSTGPRDSMGSGSDAHVSHVSLNPTRSLLRMKALARSNTTTTNSTVSHAALSATSGSTNMSDMSATSAGSLARRRQEMSRLATIDSVSNLAPMSSKPVQMPEAVQSGRQSLMQNKSSLASLKLKKSGFFKKVKALGSAASSSGMSSASFSSKSTTNQSYTKSSMTSFSSAPASRHKGALGPGQYAQPTVSQSAKWIQAQTDLHRAKSLSRYERDDRRRKQELEGYSVVNPLDVLNGQVEGDEGADGRVVETSMDVMRFNFTTLDKSVRSLSIPSLSTLASFTITVLCRPYKSDIQRLRAIYIFCTERIVYRPSTTADDDYDEQHDATRIFRSKEASADEMAHCVQAMCELMQIPCEVVRGYLKAPGEVSDGHNTSGRVNHSWNAAIVDGEWRMIDASLASPTHPRRSLYTNCGANIAEDFYFLAKPSELIFSHIPRNRNCQHILPALSPDLIFQLPSICPAMFKHGLFLCDFDMSLLRTSGPEIVQIDVQVPADVDCVAEIEVRGYVADADGDLMESGEVLKSPAMAQPYWVHGRRIFRVKGLLPDGERSGVLKIYAGRRGLLQSQKDNPYPLAVAFPISHVGKSYGQFDFVTLHPTPQALRYDLYVVQPQCRELARGSTIVFDMKQFPNNVESPVFSPTKSAKLAIQSPSGKMTRMSMKDGEMDFGAERSSGQISWEAIVSCSETGVWRGLVMADRSSTWVVFAEWVCVQH
ncbi:hypothetical protein BZA70DRAFT_280550 [Myxozyma melibiosi]|uniref:Transglutaminase-like domain-containing protein n=1 Tax=Myxozyma melibiosi TaxID=54550 RepID=A0ABR1F3G1_9ASCO